MTPGSALNPPPINPPLIHALQIPTPEEVAQWKQAAEQTTAWPQWWNRIAALGLLVGLLTLLRGWSLMPHAAWGAFLANWLFWTGLAQGGVILAAAFHITESRWGRTVQRIAGGTAAFLPGALLLFWLLGLGRSWVFPWLAEPKRSSWLNPVWLFVRDSLALGVMTVLSLLFLYHALRPDVHAVRERNSCRDRFTLWLTRHWRGEAQERERSHKRLRRLASLLILAYFPAHALLAIDLGMSIDPGYHSSLYPLLYLSASFYAALGWVALVAMLICRTKAGREIIAPAHRLDVGNLLWAFAILLLYFGWTEYFVVWMGNLPDEAAHHLQRWRAWPWSGVAWAALTCACLLPALSLFTRAGKRNSKWLGGVGVISLLGGLLQRFTDIMPSLPDTSKTASFFIAVGVSLGFGGAFGLCYGWLMRRVPLYSVADPMFEEALVVREYPV